MHTTYTYNPNLIYKPFCCQVCSKLPKAKVISIRPSNNNLCSTNRKPIIGDIVNHDLKIDIFSDVRYVVDYGSRTDFNCYYCPGVCYRKSTLPGREKSPPPIISPVSSSPDVQVTCILSEFF